MTENNYTKNRILLIISIIIISFNSRAAITGIGCLVGMLQSDLGLSAGQCGFITTIPLIAFALSSPLITKLSDKYGEGKSLMFAFVIMVIGLAMRSYAGVMGLFAGTVLLGIGVAFGNVLLPVIITGCFPKNEGIMTGVYTSCMCVFASIAAGISAPVAEVVGWRGSLGIWIVLAAVTAISWIPFTKMKLDHPKVESDSMAVSDVAEGTDAKDRNISSDEKKRARSIYTSPVAIWVAIYMGTQCLFYYGYVAWMPSILADRGFTATTAGYWYSVFQLAGIPASFLMPTIAQRRPDEKVIATITGLVFTVATLMIGFGNSDVMIILGVVLSGLASGSSLSISMLMISRRASNPKDTVRLSGFVQCAGYLISAVGPLLMGYAFDFTASWTPVMVGFVAVGLVLAVSGWYGGKDIKIGSGK